MLVGRWGEREGKTGGLEANIACKGIYQSFLQCNVYMKLTPNCVQRKKNQNVL